MNFLRFNLSTLSRPLFYSGGILVILGLVAASSAQPLADPHAASMQIIRDAAGSKDPLLRMHGVEAIQFVPTQAVEILGPAFKDPNPAVRWAALVTAGRLGLSTLAPSANTLSQDSDQEIYVRAAAAFAAHRGGLDADLAPIIQLLGNPDPGQCANATILLSMLDEPSAIPMLKDAARDPMTRSAMLNREIFRLQLAEALVLLGDEESVKVIRSAVYSDQDELRVLAVIILGRTQDHGMTGNLIRLLAKNPVELRLAAAEALGRMGIAEGLPVMLQAAEATDAPAIRAQAALALGQLAFDPRAQQALRTLLADPAPGVRIAAAAAWVEADPR